MITTFIALGTNLGELEENIKQALALMTEMPHSKLGRQSSLYRSKPWGSIQHQPEFINAVVELNTELEPLTLLKELNAIEKTMGRLEYEVRWGPRVIDLDIILYGNQNFHNKDLTIPHLHLEERDFVLFPLLEIAPDLILPDGRALRDIIAHCPDRGLVKLNQETIDG